MSAPTLELDERQVVLAAQEMPGGPVGIATHEAASRAEKVTIGPQDEWEVTLPLDPAGDFLATERQRFNLGSTALDRILAENPNNRHLGFARLRDMVKERTGINDAAATLILYAREGELK